MNRTIYGRTPAACVAVALAALTGLPAVADARQIHDLDLRDANGQDDCFFEAPLVSAGSGGVMPQYEVAGHTRVWCRYRVSVEWDQLPPEAGARFRMKHHSAPVVDYNAFEAAYATISGTYGYQQVLTSFLYAAAFNPKHTEYAGPLGKCRQEYEKLVDGGADPKELLANGFRTSTPATVDVEVTWRPAGSNEWEDYTPTHPVETLTHVGIRCGGNPVVAEAAIPTARRTTFRVTGVSLMAFLGDAATPLSGKVETTCPAELTLVAKFTHEGRVPSEIRSRFQFIGGPTTTEFTTPVPHDVDDLSYVQPELVLKVPIPLPATATLQPQQPQAGGVAIVQLPQQQGPQLAQQMLPGNEHKGTIRLHTTAPQNRVSNPVDYHIVCSPSGPAVPTVGGIAAQTPPDPPQPDIAAQMPQQPPPQPPGAEAVPRADRAGEPEARAAQRGDRAAPGRAAPAGRDAFARYEYVVEVPGHGSVGGFASLEDAAPPARGRRPAAPSPAELRLSGGTADSQLRQAIASSRTIVVVRRDGGRDVCRMMLRGATLLGARALGARDGAEITLRAARVDGDC